MITYFKTHTEGSLVLSALPPEHLAELDEAAHDGLEAGDGLEGLLEDLVLLVELAVEKLVAGPDEVELDARAARSNLGAVTHQLVPEKFMLLLCTKSATSS